MDISTLKPGDKVWVHSKWSGNYAPFEVTVSRVVPGTDFNGGPAFWSKDTPEECAPASEELFDRSWATREECVADAIHCLENHVRLAKNLLAAYKEQFT